MRAVRVFLHRNETLVRVAVGDDKNAKGDKCTQIRRETRLALHLKTYRLAIFIEGSLEEAAQLSQRS